MSLPPKETIDEWKREYGRVFSASYFGVDYVFRAVSYREFSTAQRMGSQPDAEDYIIACALLHPGKMNFDDEPAGVIPTLTEEILDISGFSNPKIAKSILDEQRERADEVWGLMKAFVLSTMPSYKEEELDDLNFEQLAGKVALSEQIIKVNQAAFGAETNELTLDLIDPEEEAQKQAKQAQQHASTKKPGQAGHNDPIAQKLQQAFSG